MKRQRSIQDYFKPVTAFATTGSSTTPHIGSYTTSPVGASTTLPADFSTAFPPSSSTTGFSTTGSSTTGSSTTDSSTKLYWSQYSKQISNQLWSNTLKESSQDTANWFLAKDKKKHKYWFSIKISRLQSPAITTPIAETQNLWQKTMDAMVLQDKTGNEKKKSKKKPPLKKRKVETSNEKPKKETKKKKPPAEKSIKLAVFPSKKQRTILNQWMGATRWVYNQCLSYINQETKAGRPFPEKGALRSKFVHNTAFANKNKWMNEIPYDVRDNALRDLMKNYKSNKAKGVKFKLQYKSKKDDSGSMTLQSKHWSRTSGFYYDAYNKWKCHEDLPKELKYDCRLIKTKLGKYFLCIPQQLEIRTENQSPQEQVIALDPGIRTFQTGFDLNGNVLEWAKGDIGRISRLCYFVDKLQSKWSQKDCNHRKRYRLKKAACRLRCKIRNLVDECHKQLVNFLLKHYNIILLPSFETSQMVKRAKRRIHSKTARAMLTWSHYRFKQRLLFKQKEFPNRHVLIVNEHYTSKTCPECGHIHTKLGGNKQFHCPQCHFELDRDINGSRNIYIRFVTLYKR